MIAEKTGASVVPIPVDDTGTIDIAGYSALLDSRVKMVVVNQVSNALGTINPVEDMISQAHAVGAKVLIDGAQAIAHWAIDVQAMNCDFYVFSGHKLFGPTGIGVLYGKRELLEQMPPYQGGGEMIETVSFDGTTFNQLPYKFEAGTPDIAGAIGLAAAIDYVNNLDRAAVSAHEDALLAYATEKASKVPGLKIVGTAASKTAVLGFVLEGTHPSDIGMLLDQQGVAVRTGHHCAQPIMHQYGIPGTVRASFSFYNTFDDIDRLFIALEKVRQLLL
jgi:cysteine desulfurase/selenocysteine lyase